ncbi:phosphate transport system regulatory protein PhoU [Bacillus sp. AFS018417]|uniref:Phosphate-specific transport system accessory protein PhoU n=1 Tax=Bacillus rhizoplanae TaxID=2880966 RepID=A0ABN8A1G6_9BACI|nr:MULTISPECIES: phosphate signaling complex protein PhoU [Bacillus]MCP1125178.1 phosphate signaling complex protein PhoU [Bacillus sp. 3103sda1]PEZ07768.1 phosphate transport system regulatory protein PhoU [Bacillus sp. AFS018417]CAG9612771.1 Phosphate-specific transport system accessory protein PhoU [Bacillus rhizoplanae]
MVREQFQYDLQALQQKIIELGELAKQALEIAMEGLRTRDVEKALEVIDGDYRMDNLEEEINDFALMLITKQQPVASDLRRIFISIKTATDLERIADHAVNIAKSTIRLGEKEVSVSLQNLENMFGIAIDMLQNVIQAYREENLTYAKKIAEMDDEVDELYGKAIREFISSIPDQPETIGQITQLSFIARYIERVADHSTNIAENVFYLVKGKHYLLNE